MESPVSTDRLDAVRRFNRFYTRRLGVLQEGLLQSPFTLAETRVLYELAHAPQPPTASALARALELDAGYLSRRLRGLTDRALVEARRAGHDARQQPLVLTDAGRRAFEPLEDRARQQVAGWIGMLADAQQQHLLEALRRMER